MIGLPVGSTPVDFAYAVHSNVGDTCVGARINGEIKPYEDVEAEYDLGGMSVEEYVENNGGYILTNPDDENEKYVVLNYGL